MKSFCFILLAFLIVGCTTSKLHYSERKHYTRIQLQLSSNLFIRSGVFLDSINFGNDTLLRRGKRGDTYLLIDGDERRVIQVSSNNLVVGCALKASSKSEFLAAFRYQDNIQIGDDYEYSGNIEFKKPRLNIAKFDQTGKLLWAKNFYGGIYLGLFDNFFSDSKGSIYLSFLLEDKNEFYFDDQKITPNNTKEESKFLTIKIDKNGNLRWCVFANYRLRSITSEDIPIALSQHTSEDPFYKFNAHPINMLNSVSAVDPLSGREKYFFELSGIRISQDAYHWNHTFYILNRRHLQNAGSSGKTYFWDGAANLPGKNLDRTHPDVKYLHKIDKSGELLWSTKVYNTYLFNHKNMRLVKEAVYGHSKKKVVVLNLHYCDAGVLASNEQLTRNDKEDRHFYLFEKICLDKKNGQIIKHELMKIKGARWASFNAYKNRLYIYGTAFRNRLKIDGEIYGGEKDDTTFELRQKLF